MSKTTKPQLRVYHEFTSQLHSEVIQLQLSDSASIHDLHFITLYLVKKM